MTNATVTHVNILGVREAHGVLIIDSCFTLSDGTTFDYESHNEIDSLHDLRGLGGTQSCEAKEALGEGYLEIVAYELVERAKKRWGGKLDGLLAEVRYDTAFTASLIAGYKAKTIAAALDVNGQVVPSQITLPMIKCSDFFEKRFGIHDPLRPFVDAYHAINEHRTELYHAINDYRDELRYDTAAETKTIGQLIAAFPDMALLAAQAWEDGANSNVDDTDMVSIEYMNYQNKMRIENMNHQHKSANIVRSMVARRKCQNAMAEMAAECA